MLVAIGTKLKSDEIPLLSSNSLQNFKQIGHETPGILHFHFSMSCRIVSVASYLNGNKAKTCKMATSILIKFLTLVLAH